MGRPVPSTNRGEAGCAGCPERAAAGHVGADAGADPARCVGVDLELVLDPVRGRGGVVAGVLVDERATQHHHVVGARVPDVVATLGQRAVVAGTDQQVAAALAAVGAGEPEVGDPAEPHVVDDAQGVFGGLQHQRPAGEVEEGAEVDGVGVRGQEQRPGVHQLGADQHVAVHDARPEEPLPQGVGRDALDRVHERLQAVHVVEVVAQLLGGLARRVPVVELQGPHRGLDARRAW